MSGRRRMQPVMSEGHHRLTAPTNAKCRHEDFNTPSLSIKKHLKYV